MTSWWEDTWSAGKLTCRKYSSLWDGSWGQRKHGGPSGYWQLQENSSPSCCHLWSRRSGELFSWQRRFVEPCVQVVVLKIWHLFTFRWTVSSLMKLNHLWSFAKQNQVLIIQSSVQKVVGWVDHYELRFSDSYVDEAKGWIYCKHLIEIKNR